MIDPRLRQCLTADSNAQYRSEWVSGHGTAAAKRPIENAKKDNRLRVVSIDIIGYIPSAPSAATEWRKHSNESTCWRQNNWFLMVRQQQRQLPSIRMVEWETNKIDSADGKLGTQARRNTFLWWPFGVWIGFDFARVLRFLLRSHRPELGVLSTDHSHFTQNSSNYNARMKWHRLNALVPIFNNIMYIIADCSNQWKPLAASSIRTMSIEHGNSPII